MSFLYICDARVKLFCLLLLTLLVFLTNELVSAICLLFFFIIVRFFVKIPGSRAFGFPKRLSLLAVFIILVQTLFFPGDSHIVSPLFPGWVPLLGGLGSLKWEGFILGIVIVCRLSALLLLLPLFTETTPYNRIAAGLCMLGFNYKSAFIITTAFNFIPFIKDEAFRIMDAQKLRNFNYFDKKASFFSGIKAYCSLLVPLMLGVMRKAQVSSIAMDSRAFGIYKTRTWIDKPQIKYYDFLLMAACFVFFVCILFLNYYLAYRN
ncbi:MAG: energy-coupling factor transporter transmembrane protein EcfT [Treponema sp.]|nr:energy-coupling factor transporter transmembrane protein EcfT [Treponema sp.]